MGRKVRLWDCSDKQYGDSDSSYKAPNGKYYSSEAVYMKLLSNQEYWNKCLNLVIDILDYQAGMKLPGIIYKRFKEHEVYTYEVLYETLLSQADYFRWKFQNATFDSEKGKIFYICSVVDNHINDVWKKHKAEEENKKKLETKIDNEMAEDLTLTNSVQKTKDISKWLDD